MYSTNKERAELIKQTEKEEKIMTEIKKAISKHWTNGRFEDNEWIDTFVCLANKLDKKDCDELLALINKFDEEIKEWAEVK